MSDRKVWTLNRVIVAHNGTMIRSPIKHFSTKEACEEAIRMANEAYTLFGSGVLVVNGRPVMPIMKWLEDMRIQGIGHDMQEGEIHEAALFTPDPQPTPKIFIPGVQ